MRVRPSVLPLAFALVVGGSLLVTATASSAAGADHKSYATAPSFSGAVAGQVSGLQLVDYRSTDFYDRVIGSAGRKQSLSVNVGAGPTTCRDVSLSFFGSTANWANTVGLLGGRMTLSCTFPDGARHRFSWGVTKDAGGYVVAGSRTDCLSLNRTAGSATDYTVEAAAGTCLAQDQTINNAEQQVGDSRNADVPFSMTFSVVGTVPLA